MSEVLETELLRHCLSPIQEQASAVRKSFEPEQLDTIRDSLAELLLTEAESGQVPIGTRDLDIRPPKNFKSVMYRSRGSTKIIAFNFRDAAYETTLQILGLSILLFTNGPSLSTIPQLGGILKTLWSKLVVLRRPSDSDAIDVLEALIRVRARFIASKQDIYPTTAEIQCNARLSTESAKLAFTKLRSRGVLKVVTWGGQQEDVSNAANRWAVTL